MVSNKLFKKFKRNVHGNDYVVADIHGEFTKLQTKLDAIGFDPELDRLFCCGDLVDRGGESHHAVEWLQKQWFHPVCGNHDDYVVRYKSCDTDNWIQDGGGWFQSLTDREKSANHDHFSALPLAIEVETKFGSIGVVHANPFFKNWADLPELLKNREARSRLMWCRKRIEFKDDTPVEGVDFVYCGHTPLQGPVQLGNVIHIETAGWHKNGRFTIVNIETGELC